MKMSLHSRYINSDAKRNRFITLKNSYHGETIGALSVSDIGLYKNPYSSILFKPYVIDKIPYVQSIHDPLWDNCSEEWDKLEKSLEKYIDSSTALIVEPIVQGAGGMKIYSKDFLNRLATWAKKHDIHLIADEIMTGIGRTGKMLACEHAGIQPDFRECSSNCVILKIISQISVYLENKYPAGKLPKPNLILAYSI